MRPARWFLMGLTILAFVGCATRPSRDGVMSASLPLTVDDLAEIREGQKHREIVLEEYELYDSPKAQVYLNAIAKSIAEVSSRPNLPYQVVLLDDDDINIFGGPGGNIYMTRGMLNFVESETEIAGILAHEIAHVAGYEYSTIPQIGKGKKLYGVLKSGTELASDSIGTYGTVAKYTIRGVEKAKPHLAKRYSRDQEVEADKLAVEFLVKAGYNPNGYEIFNDRLSKVPMEDVKRFVLMMNTHPPFQERRVRLKKLIKKNKGNVTAQKRDMLSEIRMQMVNKVVVTPTPEVEVKVREAPDEPEEKVEIKESVIFKPALGAHLGSPAKIDEASSEGTSLVPQKKRLGWFTV